MASELPELPLRPGPAGCTGRPGGAVAPKGGSEGRVAEGYRRDAPGPVRAPHEDEATPRARARARDLYIMGERQGGRSAKSGRTETAPLDDPGQAGPDPSRGAGVPPVPEGILRIGPLPSRPSRIRRTEAYPSSSSARRSWLRSGRPGPSPMAVHRAPTGVRQVVPRFRPAYDSGEPPDRTDARVPAHAHSRSGGHP